MNERIPDELYEQILEKVIIVAVDAVVYNRKRNVLLIKRNKEPCKDKWWIQGGRQRKFENPEEAVVKRVKEETDLDVEVEKFMGVYDMEHDKTAFPNVKTGVHYIVRVYLTKVINNNQEVKVDKNHSDYKWIDHIEENLDSYVKKVLKDSGVFD